MEPPHVTLAAQRDEPDPALAQTASPAPTPAGLDLPPALVWARFALLIAAPLILIALYMKDVVRPGSFQRRKPRRDVQGMPAALWLACAGVLYLAPMLGASAALIAMRRDPAGTLDIREQGIVALAAYTAGIGAALFLSYLVSPRVPGAGLKVSRADPLRGLGAFLLAIPVIEGVSVLGVIAYTLIVGGRPDAIAHETLKDIIEQRRSPWVWAVIFGAVVGAPVVEEFVFRVFLQSGLLRATGSHWAAILLSSTAFALVHRLMPTPVPWHVLPVLFTLSLAMGLAFERTGRVLVPITMHMLFNASSVALVMLAS